MASKRDDSGDREYLDRAELTKHVDRLEKERSGKGTKAMSFEIQNYDVCKSLALNGDVLKANKSQGDFYAAMEHRAKKKRKDDESINKSYNRLMATDETMKALYDASQRAPKGDSVPSRRRRRRSLRRLRSCSMPSRKRSEKPTRRSQRPMPITWRSPRIPSCTCRLIRSA